MVHFIILSFSLLKYQLQEKKLKFNTDVLEAKYVPIFIGLHVFDRSSLVPENVKNLLISKREK